MSGNKAATKALRQLAESNDMQDRDAERRTWCVPLRLEVEETSRTRTIEVTTVDLSTQGMAFLYPGMLNAGTIVRVNHNGIRVSGWVRNCVHVRGKEHRIGVMFGDERPGRMPSAASRTEPAENG